MSHVDHVLILIGIYVVSYLVFDKVIFRLFSSLGFLAKLQILIRVTTLAAIIAIIGYALWQIRMDGLDEARVYWYSAQFFAWLVLGWIALEFLLSLFAPFAGRRRKAEAE